MFGHKPVDCRKKSNNRSNNGKGKKSDNCDRKRDSKQHFNGKCNHCGYLATWRRIVVRRKPKRMEHQMEWRIPQVMMKLMMAHEDGSFDSIYANTWLGDTGSTAHMTNSLEGMFNLKKDQGHAHIGDRKLMTSVQIGSKQNLVVQKNREIKEVTLQNLKYVPELLTNLINCSPEASMVFSW